jgi:hypothetical protein
MVAGAHSVGRGAASARVGERFTAPIETIPGGNLVRAGIRALPGFQSVAYQAAMDAEAERVAASFVVWRGTGSRYVHVASSVNGGRWRPHSGQPASRPV